ncbi:MAG: BMP family ABC transporter substrate-binding protein, partial [Clostridiales bacterium]|nr:BMP family ABC transporter substrate-binding protein [Clostridiales bacterium]
INLLVVFAACGKIGGNKVEYGTMKIGVIYTKDYSKSFYYAYSFDQGLVKACKDAGISEKQIIRMNINKNYADEIASLIERGCNVIITTDTSIIDSLVTKEKDSLKQLITNNKNVTFLNYGFTDYNLDNQSSFYAKIYEAQYLAGIAAGMKTKTNAVAFIPTYGTSDSFSTCLVNAFAVGVHSVNKDAEVFTSPLNTEMDLVLEKSKTEGLIDEKKCDVIAHSLCTELCPNAAEAKGVAFITYNGIGVTNETKMNMFSVNTDWSVFLNAQFKSIVEKSFSSKHKMCGLSDGTVSITAPNTAICDKKTIEAFNAAKKKLISGELEVFEMVVYDSFGRTLVAASGGSTYSNDDLINHFDKYNFNVTMV